MTRPLVTAVIGFGKISSGYADDPVMAKYYRYTTHAQVLRVHKGFSWVSVVDPAPEARQGANSQWGIADVADQIANLKNREEIEVAVLALPPGEARLEALQAFPNLKAVLIEKPLGRNFDDALVFLRACAARKIKVQVNLWRRADQTFRRLAAGDLAKSIGRLQTGLALYGNGLRNNGIHAVDLLRMFFGEVKDVLALAPPTHDKLWPIPGDIQVPAMLSFEAGFQIQLSPIDFFAYRENGFDLWGDRGRLSILQEGLYIASYPLRTNRAMSAEYEVASDQPALIPSTVGDAFWHIYDDLAQAVHHNRAVCSPGFSALRSEAVIEAIVRSSQSGQRETPIAIDLA